MYTRIRVTCSYKPFTSGSITCCKFAKVKQAYARLIFYKPADAAIKPFFSIPIGASKVGIKFNVK